MAEYIVEERNTGAVVYAYTADVATDFPEYPFAQYNHILKNPDAVPVPGRRMTKLAFVARLGEPAFVALLAMAKQSLEVEAMMKLIEWAQPDPDGTSIDLDDPRFQRLHQLEPALVAQGVVSAGWASEVLA